MTCMILKKLMAEMLCKFNKIMQVVYALAVYRKDHPNYKMVIAGLSLGAAVARLT